MKLVIVESPAKAKTINKYLGSGYIVLASYGHLRDLPSKNGSVDPDNQFDMVWEISKGSNKHLSAIKKAMKEADELILATDPDREGEAISWHIYDILKKGRLLAKKPVCRVVFHEITKSAIQKAIANPRELDQGLIDAYLARRALDYLVGFTLSPVLWRKLPGCKSAGRVQSVALRLICDRELEVEAFKPQEYWHIEGQFDAAKPVTSKLTHYKGKKLDKFDLPTKDLAEEAAETASGQAYTVLDVQKKKTTRRSAAPFTTSTLQQEAARKLYFGTKRTMQTAQKLYEGVKLSGGDVTGLITYMRTDSVVLSKEAIGAIRGYIDQSFGAQYTPEKPVVFKTKAQNAQEAHEAIRPTDVTRHPDSIKNYVNEDQLKLYTLIWKRTVASQMAPAIFDQVSVDIGAADRTCVFRASGSVLIFDGFLKLYREGVDDSAEEEECLLPPMTVGQDMPIKAIVPHQHFTQPPPRYSEASLVKKLEELGIGRPSTYASIISVLQDRNYVSLDKRRFVPEDFGLLVTVFLKQYFSQYVEYDFTANLEEKLDGIASSSQDWQQVLTLFWQQFNATVTGTADLKIGEVLDELNRALSGHFFPENPERTCPTCKKGKLSLRLGKYGGYISCDAYPECQYVRRLQEDPEADAQQIGEDGEAIALPRDLGFDPETKEPVTVKRGPYGIYMQLGLDGDKPKRSPLPEGVGAADVTLEQALKCLSLPKNLGDHPETGYAVSVGVGRFGPFVKYREVFYSLKEHDPYELDLPTALTVLTKGFETKRPLGKHPKKKKMIVVSKTRYGWMVGMGKIKSSLGKTQDPQTLTLDEAIALIDQKDK